MSSSARADFVEEFSFRTKINYCVLMRDQAIIENNQEKRKFYERELEDIQLKMRVERYGISRSYEVTQLINSILGLLIFPEQNCFKQLRKCTRSLEEMFPNLYQIVSAKDGKYINTYRYIGEGAQERCFTDEDIRSAFEMLPLEEATPFDLVRHMRNAVAHEHVSIRPISEGGVITSVVFEDEGYGNADKGTKNLKYKTPRHFSKDMDDPRCGWFMLEIDVDSLEGVLFELCDAINGLAKNA